jgi:hypothetical protein
MDLYLDEAGRELHGPGHRATSRATSGDRERGGPPADENRRGPGAASGSSPRRRSILTREASSPKFARSAAAPITRASLKRPSSAASCGRTSTWTS